MSSSLASGQSDLISSMANGLLDSEIADEVDFEAQSGMMEIAAYHAAQQACGCDDPETVDQANSSGSILHWKPLNAQDQALMNRLLNSWAFQYKMSYIHNVDYTAP